MTNAARANVFFGVAVSIVIGALLCGAGSGAAADPMPAGTAAPQSAFYPIPSATPADDIPTIVRGPMPLPAAQGKAPPGATPGPVSTSLPLAEGTAVVVADEIYGSGTPNGNVTALGHVDIRYGDVDILADQAVYDGVTKVITATGHVRFVNADGDTATADALDYHTDTGEADMQDVVGESSQLYAQEQQIQGFLYYHARSVVTYRDGHTILRDGWVTTCDLSHVAYHITGREIEIRPGDRLIARHSDLYLGKYLVAALGVLVIPLSRTAAHQNNFAPTIGYNSTFGFFIKTYINFYRDPYFYGTYHVDLYQRVGIGLGADIYFARRDGRGQGELSVYDLRSDAQQVALTGQRNSAQASLNVQEPLGQHLTGSLQFAYTGQSSVFSSLPPQTTANVSIAHLGLRTQTNYGLNLSNSAGDSSLGLSMNHTIQFSPTLSQSFGLTAQNTNVAGVSYTHAVGLTTDTHFSGEAFDGDLNVTTNHGYQYNDLGAVRTPLLSFDKVPELTLNARPFELDGRVPIDVTFVGGVYDDPYETFGSSSSAQHVETSRFEANVQIGSALLRLGNNSDITAMADVRQDAYGTGDLRGLITENYTLHTLYGDHADTTFSYDIQSVRGFTPMQSFDSEYPANQYTEALDVYNGSYYRFTASTSYDVLAHTQSFISYQLTAQPNPYASLTLGTSFDTQGGGYGPLSIALQTPVTKTDYLEMLADYDFKLHGLQGQNYYLTHNVNNCYLVRVAYLQPLHEVDLSVSLLAFPGQGVSFGFTNPSSLLPTSFGSAP
jgi:OstA-like protein